MISKVFNVAAKIGGALFLLILVASVFIPGIVADEAGNFHRVMTSSKYYGINWARDKYLIDMWDSGKVTREFRVDSAGMLFGTNQLARLDSFTTAGYTGADSSTTLSTDTLIWPGAKYGDLVMVSPVTPDYSTTPDSGAQGYTAYVLKAGGKVVTNRVLKGPASTFKKGAEFLELLVSKNG